jgi:3-deoxy-D-manno-octulosonic-acid transferase
MLFLYNILLWVAALFLVPWYTVRMMRTGKYRQGFGQRLGFLPPAILAGLTGRPRLWFHAVSVGEVTAAAAIIAALRKRLPGAAIILSTTTDTGQEMARRIVTAANALIYYPLDIPCAVRRAIDNLRPDIFVLTETELWPNFIGYCRERRVNILMANGRLSPRSFRRYRLTCFFWKGILAAFAGVGVISELDAERFRSLGAPAGRLKVCGNAKYDSLAAQTSAALLAEMQTRLNIGAGDPVLVAGSTHEGEETVILGVYGRLLRTYPGCKLIIVPRHVERASSVVALIREAGFGDMITMSSIIGGRQRRDERVIVVDIIGELFKVYGLATVVFCGGSLVAKGGQNIMEAAAWGKVIFYGPFMDDFREERMLLENAGAGITVRDGDELLTGILKMMADRSAMARRGEAGRRLVAANSGAADRYVDMIINCTPHSLTH